MKIISWNVRGAGQQGFKYQLHDLIKFHYYGHYFVKRDSYSKKAQNIIEKF